MIHHRPQGFDGPHFRHSHVMSSAVRGDGLTLRLKWPPPQHNPGLAQNSARHASLRIDRDGKVCLILPCLGMSEAIRTSIAALIADWLDVALDQVHLEQASPERQFAAGETPDTAADDHSEVAGAALKPLSEASATARAMLIAAAAERWGVNIRSCHAHEGKVIHTSTWRKLGYGELAIDAAYRPIPMEAELPKLPRAGVGPN